jgi:thiopurine S-methyltransferase
MREPYNTQISSLMSAHTQLCLIAIEYDQNRVDGPPFSVPENETRKAYLRFQISKLSDKAIDLDNQKFNQKNLPVSEKIYLIKSR